MRVIGPNSKDLIKKSSTGIQVVIGPDMNARGMFFATTKFPKNTAKYAGAVRYPNTNRNETIAMYSSVDIDVIMCEIAANSQQPIHGPAGV